MSWYDELDETEEEEPPACSGPALTLPLNSQLNSPEPQMVVTNLFIGEYCFFFFG
jgi:hypothetical protein